MSASQGGLGPDIVQDRRRFQIERCLGRGGFGEVYKARMVSVGGVSTDVAIKVLLTEVDPASQAIQRLRDEGRLLGALRHPSILKIYDLTVLEGRVALITEYVDGQDLDRVVKRDPTLSVRAAVEVVGNVAAALHAAWETEAPGGGPMHLIHRDIKPANIRLGRHGEVKLLDFGIARAANVEREAKTATHTVIGSFPYMSPERFLQESVGAPCDVFALGCVLYEAIHRERLFLDKKLKEMYVLCCDEEVYAAEVEERLAALPADVDPRLVALLRKTLAFEQDARPTAGEVARACDEIADELSGASLKRWARDREWPPPRKVTGVLDGRVLTEGSFAHLGAISAEFLGARSGERTLADTAERSLSDTDNRTLADPHTTPFDRSATVDLPRMRPPVEDTLPLRTIAVAGVAMSAAAVMLVGGGLILAALVQQPRTTDAPAAVVSPAPAPVPVAAPAAEPEGAPAAEAASPPAEPALAEPAPAEPATAEPATAEPAPAQAATAGPAARPEPAPAAAPAHRSDPPAVARPSPAPPAAAATITPPPPEPVARIIQVTPQPAPQPAVQVVRVVPPPAPVAPAPVAAPAPAAAEGRLVIDGSVLVELRSGGQKRRAGFVPAGTWEVWADFGDGLQNTGQKATVYPGAAVEVSCSKLRRSCSVGAP